MKNKVYLYSFIGIFLSLLFVVSCDSESKESQQTGYIQLGVEKNEVLYTRTGEPVTDEVLGVYFINAAGDTTKQFQNYKEEVEGQRILLPVGTYDVKVSSASTDEPLWDTPAYYGDTTLIIKAGEISSAGIECKITNTKVTVEFTPNVAKYFSYYEALVAGKSGELNFVMDEGRAGFYSTDKFTVTLNLVNKNNGLNFQFVKVFPDILPRYHYKLKFDTDDSDGDSAGGNIDVTIDEELEEVECVIKIPGYTQLMDIPRAPTMEVTTRFSGDSQDMNNQTSITFTKVEGVAVVDKHQVVISTVAGLKNLYVRLSDTFVQVGMPVISDWLIDENVKNNLDILLDYNEADHIYTMDMTGFVNNYLAPNESSDRVYTLLLSALDVYQQEIQTLLSFTVRPDLSLMTYQPKQGDIWAKRATLRGYCDVSATDVYFKYGKTSDPESNWLNGNITREDNSGDVKLDITGLESSTDYSYKLYGNLNGENVEGEAYSFTTESDLQLPNSGFEDWDTSSKAYLLYKNTEMFWDSGNHGSSTMSVNLTQPDSDYVKSGDYSARLESQYVGVEIISAGRFAAGNLFAGIYQETIGASSITNAGGRIDFGREFTSRPLKLRGWYRYSPVKIDNIDSNANLPQDLINEGANTQSMDKAHIYVALSDGGEPYTIVNTTASGNTIRLFDRNHESILAYGEFVTDQSTTDISDEFKEFEVVIDYYSLDRKPTHIIIVCSASKYGDYFTGGKGSILWLDDFELIYE